MYKCYLGLSQNTFLFPLHAGDDKQGIHPAFKTQGRRHQKAKHRYVYFAVVLFSEVNIANIGNFVLNTTNSNGSRPIFTLSNTKIQESIPV